MHPTNIPIDLHVSEYDPSLARSIDAGLAPDASSTRPHALCLSLKSGREARLIDFSAWRSLGHGSSRSNTISGEPAVVRDALSVAAFRVGDSGGFIGTLPRDRFEQPVYYFMTKCVVAYDRNALMQGVLNDNAIATMARWLYVAQTRGASAHEALQAQTQVHFLLENLFQHSTGAPLRYLARAA